MLAPMGFSVLASMPTSHVRGCEFWVRCGTMVVYTRQRGRANTPVTHTHTNTHTDTHTHGHTHKHTHICKNIHIHTHTHTYVNTNISLFSSYQYHTIQR